ncbi:MAG: nuclear transport factor 2 family protein [Gammaproteobacteria bacterium]|nr:nuclear transport factor 2 family protein [Gammaproteobacteria bacterium]
MNESSLHADNKAGIYQALRTLAAADGNTLDETIERIYHPDARWYGSHPINELEGTDAIKHVWQQLRRSFPDMERRDSIFLVGTSGSTQYAAAVGVYQSNFMADWLGVPATHGVAHLRYGEVHELIDGRISHTYALWDLLDLLHQAGIWPIAPSLGAELAWPAPATADGVRLGEEDAERSASSIALVHAMHQGLFRFDQKDLDSMQQHKYWTRNFLWYGPAGIGTARGMEGYRAHHQAPFLRAFPDRSGAGHYIDMGCGSYAVTGGWPSVQATHAGPGWLGLAATGKRVTMRVMDFYRIENGLIAENWIPIDIIEALLQLGTDVLARVAHLRGRPNRGL